MTLVSMRSRYHPCTGDHSMQIKSAEEVGNLHASREYRFAAILNFIPKAIATRCHAARLLRPSTAPLNVTPDVVSLCEAEQNKLGQRIGTITFTNFAVVQDDASNLSMRICSGVKPR